MADTQINVGMNVDGVITGTEKAKRSLKDLGGAASEAGKAAGKVGDGTDAAAAKIERDTRRISNEFKRLQVAAETAGKSLSESMAIKANAYGVPLASIQAQIDGAKAFEKAQLASNAALLNGSSSLQKVGMSAAATSAALRNVPTQFTDIVTSLQGGQKPLTVLLQQGGQLKDMFGGAGNAAKALGGYVLGLVNPYTIAAAAAGGLFLAYNKGAAEGEAYNKALIMTGNSAGTTAVQLSNMAQAVSQATGGTVGAAADALAQLAGSSGIASSQFERVAATAVAMEKATGVAVADTVKQFSELGKDPLQASLKLNDSTRFLTMSVYEQIKALTEQGRTIEAGVVAQNAFFDVNQQRTTPLLENLSRTTQAYKILAGWIGKVADAAKEPFRAPDIEADLSKQIAIRENFVRSKYTGQVDTTDKTLIALKEQLAYHQHIADSNRDLAAYQAKGVESVKAQIDADKEHDKYLSKAVQQQHAIAQAVALYANVDLAKGSNLKNYVETIKGIQDKFKESAGPKPTVDLDYYATILKSISSFNEAALLELDTSHKLTESDKFRIKTLADISVEMEKQIKLANGDKKKVATAIDGAVNAESLMNEAELLKAQVELRKGAADAAKAGLAAYKDINAEEAKRITALHAGQKTIEDFVIAMNEASDAIKYESEITGLSAENQKIAIEQYKVAIELRKELRKIELSSQFDGDETGAREKAKADIVAAYAIKSSDTVKRIQLDSQQKLVTQYNSIFQKGFVDMVNGGTDTWEAFTKSLETTFKTTVADQIYKTFAEPIVIKFVASMIGLTGSVVSGVANATGSSSLMSGISAASGAKSIYGMGSSYFGGSTAATYGTTVGSQQTAMLAAQEAGMGSSSTFSTITPYAYIGAAMMADSSLYDAGYKWDGQAMAADPGMGLTHNLATSLGMSDKGASILTGSSIEQAIWMKVQGLFTGPQAAETMGAAQGNFDAKGKMTASQAIDVGQSDAMIKNATERANILAQSYYSMAENLGIKAIESTFGFNSNTGEEGQHPNIDFRVNAGSATYKSGEIDKNNTAAVTLAASRTVMTALQASELPKYLSGVFDGLTASTATQEQIDGVTKLAESYKGFHDQLQALPFEYLRDMSFAASKGLIAAAGTMENLGTLLGGYYEAFYTAEEKKAQLTKNTTAAFEKLGIVMPALDESARAWYRSEVDRLGAMDMSVASNASAYTSVLSLSGAMNTLVPAAKEASKALEDTAKTLLDAATKGASDAYSALERAVSSQSGALTITRDLASEQVAAIGSVFDTLKTNVEALYGQVGSTAAMQSAQGNAFITQALAAAQSTGYLPDSTALTDAITAARAGADSAVYASQQDADFTRLVLAGKLSALKDISGEQLTESQKALDVAQSQVDYLDRILSDAKLQLDAVSGIGSGVMSLVDAMKFMNSNIAALFADRSGQGLATSAGTGVVVGGGGVMSGADALARLDTIKGYVQGLNWGTPDADNASAIALAQAAKSTGVTQREIASAMGMPLSNIEALFAKAGIPAFAAGGDHFGGARLVGENGPEIEVTGPSRIFNANQTRSMLSGGNTSRLEALVEGLTAEVQRLRAEVKTGNDHAERSADMLDKVTEGGNAMRSEIMNKVTVA